jgi:hypothetical protein
VPLSSVARASLRSARAGARLVEWANGRTDWPRDPVIVGIGLSDYPRPAHLTAVQHHVRHSSARSRIAASKSAIDGYPGRADGSRDRTMADTSASSAAIDGTMVGGSSFSFTCSTRPRRPQSLTTLLIPAGPTTVADGPRSAPAGCFAARAVAGPSSSRRLRQLAIGRCPGGAPPCTSSAPRRTRSQDRGGCARVRRLNPDALYRDPILRLTYVAWSPTAARSTAA